MEILNNTTDLECDESSRFAPYNLDSSEVDLQLTDTRAGGVSLVSEDGAINPVLAETIPESDTKESQNSISQSLRRSRLARLVAGAAIVAAGTLALFKPAKAEANTDVLASKPDIGSAELTKVQSPENTILATGSNQSSSRVQHRHSTLKDQMVLKKVHNILRLYSKDSLSASKNGDNICHLQGLIPGIPPYPQCRRAETTLTFCFSVSK